MLYVAKYYSLHNPEFGQYVVDSDNFVVWLSNEIHSNILWHKGIQSYNGGGYFEYSRVISYTSGSCGEVPDELKYEVKTVVEAFLATHNKKKQLIHL